jgi:hypothetical protein
MSKYSEYKTYYLNLKKNLLQQGGSDFSLVTKSNYRSIFHLLTSTEYGMDNPSVANICYWDDFDPFTTHHTYIIDQIINSVGKLPGIQQINLYLIPNFSFNQNIFQLIKIAANELVGKYKSSSIRIYIHPTKFEQMVEYGVYDFNSTLNSKTSPNTYLKLELFTKLYTLNPAQTYLVLSDETAYKLFAGQEANTIHLISKYKFVFLIKERANKFKAKLQTFFRSNVKKFESTVQMYLDPNLINDVKYNDKKLDFFYQDEVKINGELDYHTMRMTIDDLALDLKSSPTFDFSSSPVIELDLISLQEQMQMTKSSLAFVSKNLSPQILEYIYKNKMY